jgi:hypothetical protein
MPIFWAINNKLSANIAASTWPIFNNNGCFDLFTEPLRYCTAHDIIGSAGGLRHNNRNWLGGIGNC